MSIPAGLTCLHVLLSALLCVGIAMIFGNGSHNGNWYQPIHCFRALFCIVAIQIPVTDLCQTSSPRSDIVDHDATQTSAMIYIVAACLLLHSQTA